MIFSKETLEVLQNFSQINPSMQFRRGTKQTTVAPNKSMIGISEFDLEIPKPFAIFELNRFLGILSLVNDPKIELEDEYAVITGDNQTVKYRYCEPRVITSWPEDKVLSLPSVDSSFELSKELLTKLNKSVSLLEVEHVAINGDGEKITISTFNPEDANCSSTSFVVGESDRNFNIVMKIKTMPILTGNYAVELCRNKMTRWTNKDKQVHYYVPAEKSSKFED